MTGRLLAIEIDPDSFANFQNQAQFQVALKKSPFANQGVLLSNKSDTTQKFLALYDAKKHCFIRVATQNECFGLSAKNFEQSFALHLMSQKSIDLVSLLGKSGTGKTLLALAAGLHAVLIDQNYNSLVIARPMIPVGKDMGYLPGDVEEKLQPWMGPIFDSLQVLFESAHTKSTELIEQGIMSFTPIAHLRGRNLAKKYVLIDEAQNLESYEIKMILTRAAEGTKVVLTGDPDQVDHNHLNQNSNGLVQMMQAFLPYQISGTIYLKHCERSALANLASQIL